MYLGCNYIFGSQVFGNEALKAVNPSNEEVYGSFPLSREDEVKAAVHAARTTQTTWSKLSRVKRAEYFETLASLIKENHDQLRDFISIETGKSLNESHAEVIEALHMCQVVASSGRQSYGEVFASELSTKDIVTIRKPKGVIAVISPWNFPAAIGSFWSSAPALLEGNTVVHKPSELTPMVNDLIARLYFKAGFPSGVYNLIHGDGVTGSLLVRADVDVILFTGSAEVGQDIRKHCAETHSKTCSIECGSKSATMVFADGNMELAIDACIASAFKLSGQRCVSSSRILVERSVLPQFKELFLARVAKLIIGDPFVNKDSNMGPLISEEQLNRVFDFNQMTFDYPQTTVLMEGVRMNRKGYFMTPHVIESEWGDRPFLKQEIFGPHVALIPFCGVDEAISIYNDTDYGLALGVISDDYRKHREIAQRCTAGMIYINGGSIAAESHVPFSSWKKSGYGSSASATWKAVTHTTTITTNYEEGKVSWAQGMK